MRAELDAESRMHVCALSGKWRLYGNCDGRIEWDHVFIYAGKQINEKWAIVGVCKGHHRNKEGNRTIKDAIQRASLDLASTDDLAKYPRKDWRQIKHSLDLDHA